MSAPLLIGYVVLGLIAGGMSGLVGIGGGVIIVPSLIYAFKFTQQQAQGTTLALMVPPIGLLAAWQYYKSGCVDLKAAGLICLGFILGGLLGARVATSLSNAVLEKLFGGLMITIGIKMLFFAK
jgi:uncharacterized membrane protein YfcA